LNVAGRAAPPLVNVRSAGTKRLQGLAITYLPCLCLPYSCYLFLSFVRIPLSKCKMMFGLFGIAAFQTCFEVLEVWFADGAA